MSVDYIKNHCVSKITPITCKWTIKKYNVAVGGKYDSEIFSDFDAAGNKLEWSLQIFNRDEYLNIGISFKNYSRNNCGTICFYLLNSIGKRVHEHMYNGIDFKEDLTSIKIITLSYLMEHRRSLVRGDVLTLECEIYIYNVIEHTMEKSLLKRKNSNTFMNNYEQLYKRMKYCDVTIELADGTKTDAHKAVLDSRSSVFAAKLKKCKKNCINITDINSDVFKEVLHFMYTGKLSNLSDMVDQLLTVANKYNVKDLKNVCEEELTKTLKIDNIENMLILADRYKLKYLRDQTVQFLATNAEDFAKCKYYKRICKKYPDLLSKVFTTSAIKK